MRPDIVQFFGCEEDRVGGKKGETSVSAAVIIGGATVSSRALNTLRSQLLGRAVIVYKTMINASSRCGCKDLRKM